jgi:hypothetical protein
MNPVEGTVFLPWRGEFGQMLLAYVRWIHGVVSPYKVVCCKPGDEPLFPSAREFFYDWEQVPDHLKNTKLLRSKEQKQYLDDLRGRLRTRYPNCDVLEPILGSIPQRWRHHPEWNFKPRAKPFGSFSSSSNGGRLPDIVVAPRCRKHGINRNFAHWQEVCDVLSSSGHTIGLIGVKEASLDVQGVSEAYKSWNYEENLSVTLQMMNHARLTLATDSAMAHLAVLNQTPVYVIYDKPGREAGHPEWPWTIPHMEAHAVAEVKPILFGWTSPETVVSCVLESIGSGLKPNAASAD